MIMWDHELHRQGFWFGWAAGSFFGWLVTGTVAIVVLVIRAGRQP